MEHWNQEKKPCKELGDGPDGVSGEQKRMVSQAREEGIAKRWEWSPLDCEDRMGGGEKK